MDRIASFCVDHTTLLPGMYLSRQDGPHGEILTWDVRMKRPNQGSYLSPAAAHTLEHLFATYARNSQYSSGVVYVGPMGCLTGFYLVTIGLRPRPRPCSWCRTPLPGWPGTTVKFPVLRQWNAATIG